MSTYTELNDLDQFEIEATGGIIHISCCDCGLVHKFSFAIEKNGNIGIALERDNRATGQRRRFNEFEFKKHLP